MTVRELPDNCLTTAWQQHGNCLMTAWLPGDYLMTAWLPDDYQTTTYWQPDDCQITAWQTDDCMATAWWLHDCLATACWQHDCLMTIRQLPNDNLMTTKQLPDKMMTAWWRPDDCLTTGRLRQEVDKVDCYKVWTFWETHKIWKNLLHGFEKSADLLSKRQNHKEDFFSNYVCFSNCLNFNVKVFLVTGFEYGTL